jgi:phenylacetaldehyde dehydrogenase
VTAISSSPTILVDVKPDMSCVREEIFGPVLAAQRYDDLDEVAAQANDTTYGLAATVWTRDISAMHKLAAKLKRAWSGQHQLARIVASVWRIQAIRLRPEKAADMD